MTYDVFDVAACVSVNLACNIWVLVLPPIVVVVHMENKYVCRKEIVYVEDKDL